MSAGAEGETAGRRPPAGSEQALGITSAWKSSSDLVQGWVPALDLETMVFHDRTGNEISCPLNAVPSYLSRECPPSMPDHICMWPLLGQVSRAALFPHP